MGFLVLSGSSRGVHTAQNAWRPRSLVLCWRLAQALPTKMRPALRTKPGTRTYCPTDPSCWLCHGSPSVFSLQILPSSCAHPVPEKLELVQILQILCWRVSRSPALSRSGLRKLSECDGRVPRTREQQAVPESFSNMTREHETHMLKQVLLVARTRSSALSGRRPRMARRLALPGTSVG